jgi:hypothetical protein
LREREDPGGLVVAGARKKGKNGIASRSLERTVIWAIKLGGYYSDLMK